MAEELNERPDPSDWLSPEAVSNKAKQNAEAIRFASLYLIFDTGPGKELLEHWLKQIENRDTAPNASHAEYAYWEGRRVFVRGIQRQIELAKNRGNIPH